jgi:Domain of unknown function (DUF4303)
VPSHAELVDAIADATRTAVNALFRDHPGHHFYYCALITTGGGGSPNLVAWSTEALEAAVKEHQDDPAWRALLKWSYADSPFYCYGEEHFAEVRRLFDALPEPDPFDKSGWLARFDLDVAAMVAAMERLEGEGLFGRGASRAGIVVNVEVMPPDHTNTERARLLNPPEALEEWLREAAEPE